MSAIGQDPTPGDGTSGASEGGQSPFDYQRGYEQLRPEYTRVTQEFAGARERLSEYEQLFNALHDSDPEVQNWAMSQLGIETDTGSQGTTPGDDDFVDPLEEQLNTALSRLEKLESARELEASERESQELDTMRDEYIGEAITYIEDGLKPQYGDNFKFSEREEEVLGNLAIAMADEEGIPDVQGAYNALYGDKGVLETNRQRWYDSKTSAAAPPPGTTIPADQKPKTGRERARFMDARLAAMEAQR